MMVLTAALAAFLLGIITITVDVIRRNKRRREAENRPIDTSIFQNLAPGETVPEEEHPAPPADLVEASEQVEAAAPEIAEPELDESPEYMQAYSTTSDDEQAALVEDEAHAEAASHETASHAVPEAEPAAFTLGAPAPGSQHILVCDAFGAGFGDKIVLADITFQVLDQGITTLMGPIGTGKSTLLRALAGMLSQSGLFKSWGAVYFRGAPVGPDNRPVLVSQRIQLIQRSALENLTFHLHDRTAGLSVEQQHAWASKWLDQAGVGDVIALLDRPFMELDQLSQRIITILREAAAEPALLLIDEPTTGLSEVDASVLLNMLERLAGFTPLLVALQNHKHAAKISNQIILLAGGQVQASCDAERFFTAPPNEAVAQFIATGTCAVAPPDASAIRPPSLPAPPPHLTAATLAAIKDEIRNTLAVEMVPDQDQDHAEPEEVAQEPEQAEPENELAEAHPVLAEPEAETFEPATAGSDDVTIEPEAEPVLSEPVAAPEVYPFEPAASESGTASAEPESFSGEPEAEPLPEPEVHAYEPAPAESVTEAEPAPEEPEAEIEAEPAIEPAAEEHEAAAPEMETAEPAFEPRPAEPLPETVAHEHEPEPALLEPAMHEAAPEPVEPAFIFEPAASEIPADAEPGLAEPALEAEPILEPIDSAAYIFEPAAPEPVTYEPEPETFEAEPVIAERMSTPFTASPPAEPAVIDMDAFPITEPLAHVPAEEPPLFDDLPTISLGAQMMQPLQMPPRSAAAQMASGTNSEDAAVTRFPGGDAAGPRGFVWIEDGRLAATPMPGISVPVDQDLDMLSKAGITVLITLTEQNFPQHTLSLHGLRNVHFPIADRQAPTTGEADVLVNQMHDLLAQGEVLAVHCLAGLGRTGTILAAYMVKEKGISAQVALSQIRHFNRQFVQTDDQEDFLVEYEVQQEQTVLLNRAGGTLRLL